MENLPSFTELVRAWDCLDGAGNPWDVDKVHKNTNIRYGSSVEVGRYVIHTKHSGVQKVTGEYKIESLTHEA